MKPRISETDRRFRRLMIGSLRDQAYLIACIFNVSTGYISNGRREYKLLNQRRKNVSEALSQKKE